MDPIFARQAGHHMFLRTILSDLMVERCMQADDPVADAELRAKLKLMVAERQADDRGADDLSQAYLHEMETFWDWVQREVRARVEEPLGPAKPLPRKKDGPETDGR